MNCNNRGRDSESNTAAVIEVSIDRATYPCMLREKSQPQWNHLEVRQMIIHMLFGFSMKKMAAAREIGPAKETEMQFR